MFKIILDEDFEDFRKGDVIETVNYSEKRDVDEYVKHEYTCENIKVKVVRI